MKKLAVLVSGRGSNLEAILNAMDNKTIVDACVAIVISDNPNAYALVHAKNHNVKALCIERASYKNREEYEEAICEELDACGVDLVVLAGFMRVLGKSFTSRYKNRALNIHPSLLPSFPGIDAQSQAIEYGVKYTGCSVHFVTDGLDNGPIIGQKVVEVLEGDDRDNLADRILKYEHELLIECINFVLEDNFTIDGRIVRRRG